MIEEREVRQMMIDLFEEQGLVIGGLVATHAVEDATVWSLMRALDAIRNRALARIGCPVSAKEFGDGRETLTGRHPAVEEYLRKVEEGRER